VVKHGCDVIIESHAPPPLFTTPTATTTSHFRVTYYVPMYFYS
jgi:hypothetical protein